MKKKNHSAKKLMECEREFPLGSIASAFNASFDFYSQGKIRDIILTEAITLASKYIRECRLDVGHDSNGDVSFNLVHDLKCVRRWTPDDVGNFCAKRVTIKWDACGL
jgi:hypothetical protein